VPTEVERKLAKPGRLTDETSVFPAALPSMLALLSAAKCLLIGLVILLELRAADQARPPAHSRRFFQISW
jgi:hypothetical protein